MPENCNKWVNVNKTDIVIPKPDDDEDKPTPTPTPNPDEEEIPEDCEDWKEGDVPDDEDEKKKEDEDLVTNKTSNCTDSKGNPIACQNKNKTKEYEDCDDFDVTQPNATKPVHCVPDTSKEGMLKYFNATKDIIEKDFDDFLEHKGELEEDEDPLVEKYFPKKKSAKPSITAQTQSYSKPLFLQHRNE